MFAHDKQSYDTILSSQTISKGSAVNHKTKAWNTAAHWAPWLNLLFLHHIQNKQINAVDNKPNLVYLYPVWKVKLSIIIRRCAQGNHAILTTQNLENWNILHRFCVELS